MNGVQIIHGSAMYSRANNAAIDCIVTSPKYPGENLPFTAVANDPDPVVEWVWQELHAGTAGDIAPYVAQPAPVPSSVSPLQMRKALRATPGLKAAADAYLATLDEEAQEAWEYATTIMRNDPFIEGARVALEMSESDADDLFRLASNM
jgi:hypothetical protein